MMMLDRRLFLQLIGTAGPAVTSPVFFLSWRSCKVGWLGSTRLFLYRQESFLIIIFRQIIVGYIFLYLVAKYVFIYE